MRGKNSYPKVVTKPGGKTGGTNTAVKRVTKPTKPSQKNASAKVKPSR